MAFSAPKTVVKLKYPTMDSQGIEITEIEMRRPTVRDQIMYAKKEKVSTEAEAEVEMFARLANVTPADIESLDMVDYTTLQKTYTGFMEK